VPTLSFLQFFLHPKNLSDLHNFWVADNPGVNSIGGNPFNVLNHTNVVSLNPVLWRGKFPDSSLRDGEQSGHSEAIAVLG
jgi:hypothetical protein